MLRAVGGRWEKEVVPRLGRYVYMYSTWQSDWECSFGVFFPAPPTKIALMRSMTNKLAD